MIGLKKLSHDNPDSDSHSYPAIRSANNIFLKRSLLQVGVGVVGVGEGSGVEARVEECRFKERLVVSLCKFSASKLYRNEAFFHSFFHFHFFSLNLKVGVLELGSGLLSSLQRISTVK